MAAMSSSAPPPVLPSAWRSARFLRFASWAFWRSTSFCLRMNFSLPLAITPRLTRFGRLRIIDPQRGFSGRLVRRMSDSGYLEAVTAWALACLRGKEGATRARADKKAAGRPIERLAERFQLDGLERRVIELLYAAERSFD